MKILGDIFSNLERLFDASERYIHYVEYVSGFLVIFIDIYVGSASLPHRLLTKTQLS